MNNYFHPETHPFLSKENVRIISENVTRRVKDKYPRMQDYVISDTSILSAMREMYESDRQHPQIMIQIVVNLLTENAIYTLGSADTSTYDNRILYDRESIGLHHVEPTCIDKLNNKQREFNFVFYR